MVGFVLNDVATQTGAELNGVPKVYVACHGVLADAVTVLTSVIVPELAAQGEEVVVRSPAVEA